MMLNTPTVETTPRHPLNKIQDYHFHRLAAASVMTSRQRTSAIEGCVPSNPILPFNSANIFDLTVSAQNFSYRSSSNAVNDYCKQRLSTLKKTRKFVKTLETFVYKQNKKFFRKSKSR